jgi:pimeloyl-ACP methyl ester carboxylesterase
VTTRHHQSDPEVDDQSNLDEWRGVGDLVALGTEQLTKPVEGMHRAIANRWLGLGGDLVEPARRIYDGLTASVYKAIRLSGAALGAAISVGADLASNHTRLPPVWGTEKGRYVQSVFNSVWGDRFDDAESPFSIELGFRDADGDLLSPDRNSISKAIPNPKARVAVMVHGLGETERCWTRNGNESLSRALEADGFSVLPVRYNTGRSVSDNGSDLADLIEAVCLVWPAPIEEVALIGHSMGGLVAREAILAAMSREHRWAGRIDHLVAIATPHFGSLIEKSIPFIGNGLGIFHESRPLKRFVEQRSVGIKDLRFGVTEEGDCLGTVRQHFVAGTVTTEPSNPFGRIVGDLVVNVGSATGRGRLGPSDEFVVGGQHHAGLLRDPKVHAQIRRWLTSDSRP